MESKRGDIATLLGEMAAKMAPETGMRRTDLSITEAPGTEKRIEVKPFNLTKPKPRIVPEPEVLPGVGFKAKPIPETSKKGFSYSDTEEYKDMIQIRADNREMEKKQYTNPKVQKFKLASDERPTHLERLLEEKEAHIQEVTSFDFKAQPPPKLPKKQPEVRMTATSIMREDALYKKKQEQEKALIEEYESNLRDASEFYDWQQEMQEKDDKFKSYQVAQRRQMAAEGAINAMEAKEKELKHRKEIADEMKIESSQMQAKLKEEAEQRRLYNQQIAADVRQMEKFAAGAMEDAYQKRVSAAKEVKAEREEIEKKVAEQIELDRQRKVVHSWFTPF